MDDMMLIVINAAIFRAAWLVIRITEGDRYSTMPEPTGVSFKKNGADFG